MSLGIRLKIARCVVVTVTVSSLLTQSFPAFSQINNSVIGARAISLAGYSATSSDLWSVENNQAGSREDDVSLKLTLEILDAGQ